MTSRFQTIFIALIGFIFLLSSCADEREFLYFQSATADNSLPQFIPTLKRNDMLAITVSSLDPEATKPFNVNASGGVSQYLIDEEGNIEFPVIGTVRLAGLTKTEAVLLLTERIKTHVRNPIISMRITNFKVTVLGDVARPGLVPVPNERITVLEALGQSGDIQLTGNRSNVLVISEHMGKRKETLIDLRNKDVFKSPAYFLNQNDVVYVQMTRIKFKQTSDLVRYSGLVISISSFAIGIVNFLTK